MPPHSSPRGRSPCQRLCVTPWVCQGSERWLRLKPVRGLAGLEPRWRLRGKSSILYGPYRILNVGELGAANQEQLIRLSPSASALIHLQQLDRHPVMGGGGAHGLIETDQTAFKRWHRAICRASPARKGGASVRQSRAATSKSATSKSAATAACTTNRLSRSSPFSSAI